MRHAWLGSLLACGLLACQAQTTTAKATAPAQAEWSYAGSTGPAHWGDLSPAWVLAKTGKHQSPVDIVTTRAWARDAAPWEASYHDTSLEILNNGHTIEDDYHDGGTLRLAGHSYELAQFHFHSPSEHTLDGRHAPMEMHLVHEDADGKLAVIGVLIEEGRAHPELGLLWQHLPASAGRTEAVADVLVNAARLLPASLAGYRYSGSLTTPPCSEQVDWLVLRQPIEASAEQIAAFRKLIHGNNRPTQPLNDRTITAAEVRRAP